MLGQRGVTAHSLVVVNGQRYDSALLRTLQSTQPLTVHHLEDACLPKALHYGRLHVEEPYFAFLDDDDEYLPDALSTRLEPLLADPAIDFVVTNGYLHVQGDDEWHPRDAGAIESDPLGALMAGIWLASCGALFRTDAIPAQYFHALPTYCEWTVLAFLLAIDGRRLRYLDVPTWRVHQTAQSLSSAPEYRHAECDAIRFMRSADIPRTIRKALDLKLSAALHGVSDCCLHRRDFIGAWKYHLASLRYRGGFGYLPYTARICTSMVKWC